MTPRVDPNWETFARSWRSDTRACGSCHSLGLRAFVARKPNFDGLDVTPMTRHERRKEKDASLE